MVTVHIRGFCNFQSPVMFTSHLAIDISSGLKKLLHHLNITVPFYGIRHVPMFPPPLPMDFGACGCTKIKGVDTELGSR